MPNNTADQIDSAAAARADRDDAAIRALGIITKDESGNTKTFFAHGTELCGSGKDHARQGRREFLALPGLEEGMDSLIATVQREERADHFVDLGSVLTNNLGEIVTSGAVNLDAEGNLVAGAKNAKLPAYTATEVGWTRLASFAPARIPSKLRTNVNSWTSSRPGDLVRFRTRLTAESIGKPTAEQQRELHAVVSMGYVPYDLDAIAADISEIMWGPASARHAARVGRTQGLRPQPTRRGAMTEDINTTNRAPRWIAEALATAITGIDPGDIEADKLANALIENLPMEAMAKAGFEVLANGNVTSAQGAALSVAIAMINVLSDGDPEVRQLGDLYREASKALDDSGVPYAQPENPPLDVRERDTGPIRDIQLDLAGRIRWLGQQHPTRLELQRVELELSIERGNLKQIGEARDAYWSELKAVTAERDQLGADRFNAEVDAAASRKELDRVTAELNAKAGKVAELEYQAGQERDELRRVVSERDMYRGERDQIRKMYDGAVVDLDNERKDHDNKIGAAAEREVKLQGLADDAVAQRPTLLELSTERGVLIAERDAAILRGDNLRTQLEFAQAKASNLRDQLDNARSHVAEMQAELAKRDNKIARLRAAANPKAPASGRKGSAKRARPSKRGVQ